MQTIPAPRLPAQAFPFPVLAGTTAGAARLPGRPMRLPRGGMVYAEGAAASELYKVVSGTIRTLRILPDGRRLVASFALPGEVFGLEGLGLHRFTAEAVTESVVIAFNRREIEDCIGREPQAAHSWQAFTLEELAAAQDRCILLGRKSACERVASFLLDLEARGEQQRDVIDLPMSRYDIADYLGLTAETVSRVLSSLRKRRLVADAGLHRLRIADRAMLEELARDGEA
jgi:CRP-like cAMP-binding protein